jgi:RNA polymerase sigma-70 factor (ECF subfamily)
MAAAVDPDRIEQARKGHAAAFEALVEARVGPMTRTAMAILGHEDEALDAVREALVIAWRELASLRNPAAFDAWLTRILVHRCRRGQRRIALPAGRVVSGRRRGARAQPAVEPAAGAPFATSSLEDAFDRLPVGERTILVLHHLDGHPLAEIAIVLRITVRTAGSRLAAARDALQRAFEQDLGADLKGRADHDGGHLSPVDDPLATMLRARADRLPASAATTVMTLLANGLRASRPGGILGWLPIGDRSGSMSGWVGWAIALAVAVLAMALLGER